MNVDMFHVVDDHPVPKGTNVRRFVEQINGPLDLHLQPLYSPELNSGEWVWKKMNVDTVGKMSIRTIAEMHAAIEIAVTRLRSDKETVRRCFR